jgi:hypothetical protein
MSAKSGKRGVRATAGNNPLDKVSERTRGRPRQADSDQQLTSRASAYLDLFRAASPSLWSELLQARDDVQVVEALQRADVRNIHEFAPLADLIRTVIAHKKFPEGHDARARFLADSLAGRKHVKARTSRDLVGELRQKTNPVGEILRVEVYVECSCGYTGQSRDWACPRCLARIPPGVVTEQDELK